MFLRDHLDGLKARTGRDGTDFVFGQTATSPFTPSYVRRQALAAWDNTNKARAEKKLPPLVPIGLHELRHSYVKLHVRRRAVAGRIPATTSVTPAPT